MYILFYWEIITYFKWNKRAIEKIMKKIFLPNPSDFSQDLKIPAAEPKCSVSNQ